MLLGVLDREMTFGQVQGKIGSLVTEKSRMKQEK